jgi:ribose transport system substrate-binding protein
VARQAPDRERTTTNRYRVGHRSRCALGLGVITLLGGFAASSAGAGAAARVEKGRPSSTPPVVSSLPSSLQAFYQGTPDSIHKSVYANSAATKTPWKLCFEDAYEGNAWRIAVRTQLQGLASLFEKKGLVSSFSYSVSNSSPTLENSQLHAFIDQHCSLILLTAGSSTGDNSSIADAHSKGIPVVAFNNYVSSPDAQVVDQPFYLWGKQMAQAIATRLHGKGTVIMLQGIAGESVAVEENAGADAVWKQYPGLKIITAYGNWTPSVTSSAILQAIGTNSGTIDAVWTTGSEAWYVAQAFQKAGRPIPYITSSPAGNTLALIKSDPSKYGPKLFGQATVPVPVADYAFDVAVRVLEGQRPRISPIMFPLSPWVGTDVSAWTASCMTQGSEAPFPVPPTAPLTENQIGAYFSAPKAVSPYSYGSTLPKAC